MKKIISLVICIMTMIGASAQTADAQYDEVLNKVISSQMSKSILENMLNENLQSLVQNGMLTPEKVQGISVALADYMYPMVLKETTDMYRENFNLDELKQVENWVTSPVGQKSIALSFKQSTKMQQIMMKPEVQQKMQSILMEYMK